jgi:hypothetical protein
MEHRAGVYGSVTPTGAGVEPRRHKLNRSNIEQDENERMNERRLRREHLQFPMILHKAAGLFKEVQNDAELQAALEKGWYADIREVPVETPAETPRQIAHMTVAQALEHVAAHANDAAKLAEIEQEERLHGNRAAVVKAIEEAKDNFGSKVAPKAKKAK